MAATATQLYWNMAKTSTLVIAQNTISKKLNTGKATNIGGARPLKILTGSTFHERKITNH